VSWYNEQGIDGLLERPRSGRPPRIPAENGKLYAELPEQPQQASVVHWTGRKFRGYICRELRHETGYSTLLRWMHEKDCRLKVPQPWPDRQDEQERQLFMEKLQEILRDENIQLWYGDEMGVDGDPRPRRRWAIDRKQENQKTCSVKKELRRNAIKHT
jgi:transposase